MVLQLLNNSITERGVIYDAQIGGTKLYIGDVFHHIAGYTAVDILDLTHVSAGGDIGIRRKPLDVNEYRTDHNNSHKFSSSQQKHK
jgi:hypothetical protein